MVEKRRKRKRKEEENENDEEEQDQALRKSDENVGDVQTLRAQNDPRIFNNNKDATPIKEPIAMEDPNDGLFHFKETGQDRGETGYSVPITGRDESETGYSVPITGRDESETNEGIPSKTEKAGDIEAEDTEFTPEYKVDEVGKGNELASNLKFQAGEGDSENTESTPQDKVREVGEGNELAPKYKIAVRRGEVDAETTESTPQEKVREVGEGNELSSNTKLHTGEVEATESTPVGEVGEENKFASNTKPPNVTEEVKSGPSETGFGVVHTASGLAQGLKGMFVSKQSTHEDVKDTTLQGEHEGKEDGGPKQQQTEAGGEDNAKEILKEYESISGPKSGENPEEEESQNLARDTQGKVSEGEGAELASNTKHPYFTEEVNSGNSENTVLWGERQGKEDEGPQQQQSEAGAGHTTGPNSGEEVKSGTPETGSGFMKKTTGSAQGLEDISPRNQSSNDNVKDTVLQEESKGQEDEGPHQQKSEAEAKAGQSYASKLYAAIESKMGYGAQTNQDDNGSKVLKSGDPIQGPTSGIGTEDVKEGEKSPVVGSFVGRNQGEDTSISPSSEKQDENVGDVQTLRAQNDPRIFNNNKDATPIKEPIAMEDPNDGLFHFKETGQGRGETGYSVPITGIDESETNVGIPSTTEKARDIEAEDTEFTPEYKVDEVGKGNELASNSKFQAGEVDSENTESTPQDKVREVGEGNELAPNTKLQSGEVEAEATESTPEYKVNEVGEGNELASNSKFQTGEVDAETTESTPQEKVREVGEGNELSSNTKLHTGEVEATESTPVGEVGEENELASNTKPPNVTEEVKSGPSETGFGVVHTASGLAQGFKGMFVSKQSTDEDVKDTTLQGEHEGKEDGGPKQQQTEAGGEDNAKEILKEYESISGPKSGENPEEEEYQNLARDTQGKVSEGEGAELASNTKHPYFTEEVNSGNSENTVLWGERQGKEDEGPQQQQSEAGAGHTTGPNSGEEVKSGTPETGSGFIKKTTGSAQGLEDISPRNQSSNDNVKDTVLQEESKGQEDEGPHQQKSEAEAKAGQSYASNLYAAIESKMGYGAQTNQDDNGSKQLKSGDPIQGPTSGIGTEDVKEGEKSPVVGSFVGRNQGEDTSISPSSEKQDENVGDVQTLRAQNDPRIFNNNKDATPIKEPIAMEDPNDGLFHFKETGQGRGETGYSVPITGRDESETNVGIPSTTEKARDVEAEDTEFTPEYKVDEVGKGNELASNSKFQAGEVDSENTESTPQDKVREVGEGNELAPNTKLQSGEVEAEATESTPEYKVNEVGEGNELASNSKFQTGEVEAETTESIPQEKVREVGEGNELASNTKLHTGEVEATESTPVSEVGEENELASNTKPPNVTEEVKSGPSEKGFGVVNTASGLAQGLKGMLVSKQSTDKDVKDTTLQGEHEGKEDGGPKQQQTEAGGKDNAKEILKEYESISGPKSGENPEEEESQNLARDTQGKVSKGEGAELASNKKHPYFTEEVNSGNSENTVLWGERQGKEDEGPQQQQSEAGAGHTTGPNSGEEVKSGTPETGSGFMKKTTGSAQGLEDISPRNQSSNDNVKDTVLQEESKGQEDEGPHQQKSEAQAKAGQSYVSRLYAAIESKMGYGAQSNQDDNGSKELKSGDPIQGPTSGIGTEDVKEGEKSPVVGSFVGRNQGEDT
ncbi:hypothetical protein KI387_035919 [Taxus chinensis]|uniref:Uncharacterized protein n=1 Tax=Taxus chinensis TaxID=29808 RepID=A0AA38FS81_TAXCH|nr:hypothetical protein KI387_035919 [Taxus chinensis]